jgi:RNA methyltransferase, TrmH family
MLSKNRIKHINSLQQKKYRELHMEFIVEGEKSVSELLGSNYVVKELLCTKDWLIQNQGLIKDRSTAVNEITSEELARISSLKSPNKVSAIASIPPTSEQNSKMFDDLVLALDNIRDPGNMGTIIRTADWFGIRNIVCSVGCVDAYNPKVVQSTMGSIVRTNIFYLDLKEFLQSSPAEVIVYGCLLDGENIYSTPLKSPAIIIIGNESNGISAELLPFIHSKLRIPDFSPVSQTGSRAESLNASLANAIVCYEFRRCQSLNNL